MSLSHSPSIVRTGLYMYLDAANPKSYPGTGTTWFDLNKNYDATLSGYTYDAGGWFVFSAGGQAITGTTTGLTTAFSNEIIYKSSVGDTHALYGRMFDRGDTTISLGTYGTYQLRVWTYAAGVRGGELQVNGIGQDGIWHHLAQTYDGVTHSLYLDGALFSSVAETGSLEDNVAISIGNGDANQFNGPIAMCRMYSRALTVAEVTQNFEATRGRYGI